jgi:hypothetical protein
MLLVQLVINNCTRYRMITYTNYSSLFFSDFPRADGAKRRARVLIPPPPAIFTPGETKALAKSKVHQLSRAWVTNDVEVLGG